jgi:hypothetical protein
VDECSAPEGDVDEGWDGGSSSTPSLDRCLGDVSRTEGSIYDGATSPVDGRNRPRTDIASHCGVELVNIGIYAFSLF